MAILTFDELLIRLVHIEKTTPVGLKVWSEQRTSKTIKGRTDVNPYYNNLLKWAYVRGSIGFSYGDARDEAAAAVGQPPVNPVFARTWGKRIGNSSVIEHKDEMYLEVKFDDEMVIGYLTKDKAVQVPEADVKAWLPSRDEIIQVRTYKLRNIEEIIIEDDFFQIRS